MRPQSHSLGPPQEKESKRRRSRCCWKKPLANVVWAEWLVRTHYVLEGQARYGLHLRMRPLCEDSGVGRATHSTPTYGKTGSILVEWQHLCCALTSHRPDVRILCHGGPVPPGSEARGGRGMRPRGKDLFNPFGKDLFSPLARKKHAWARSDSFDSRETQTVQTVGT